MIKAVPPASRTFAFSFGSTSLTVKKISPNVSVTVQPNATNVNTLLRYFKNLVRYLSYDPESDIDRYQERGF